ncbi:hypothetical protein [Nostoc sp. CCY 9925]|uniref:hypothetical protein n=1 Tax=Nostoc sp. CCY 9925 TaxID=3103865 RepID=UPI0039C69194
MQVYRELVLHTAQIGYYVHNDWLRKQVRWLRGQVRSDRLTSEDANRGQGGIKGNRLCSSRT